jgi:hypothetical protein
LVLNLENPTGATNHVVFFTDDLAVPAAQWAPLQVLSATDLPNQVRRLEVQLPAAMASRCFLYAQHE